MMQSTGVETNQEINQVMVEIAQVAVVIRHVNIVENPTIEATVLPYGKKCQKCSRDNHFKSVCRSSNGNENVNVILVAQGQGKATREKFS